MVFSTEDQIFIKVWPANSPDSNLVDYRIWWKLQERVYHNWIRDADQLKSRLIEECEQYHNSSSWSLMKRSNSGVSILEPAFEHAEDISNKNFRQAYCSIFLQRHSLTVPLPILDTSFFEYPH